MAGAFTLILKIIMSDISHRAIGLEEISNRSAGMTALFKNTISIVIYYITPVRHSGSVQNLTDGNSCEILMSIINALETIPDNPPVGGLSGRNDRMRQLLMSFIIDSVIGVRVSANANTSHQLPATSNCLKWRGRSI